MRAEEIAERIESMRKRVVANSPYDVRDSSHCLWLAEIAYQLALGNERAEGEKK
jgi:hypothetical protein